jgi:hypothetical protein
MVRVIFSNDGFEKSITASSYEEAITEMKNPKNWPIEIPNYQEMLVRIEWDENGNEVSEAFAYEEFAS